MRPFASILFPVFVSAAAAAGMMGHSSGVSRSYAVEFPVEVCDTVIYPYDGYKLHRIGDFEPETIADSLLMKGGDFSFEEDTAKFISARDTIKVPDSLRFTDPFRYKYYVALVDSLTHRQVRDSLMKSSALHRKNLDSLHARMDSLDCRKLDSLYASDSTKAARAAFLAWYQSLGKKERKAYDLEQKAKMKLAIADSLKEVHEKQQDIKDSIIANTPRILETFALPDSMQYKRLISWTVDQDFHKMDISIPDTTFNKYYNDYPFRRNDVNATWLGVAGSPTQYYNFFKRKSESGVDYYTPQESWAYSPSTLPMYNTKTAYTELAYWGTLFANQDNESDNFRIFTTQNILPELNLMLVFERYGGGGILNREVTKNKNFVFAGNYLGKKYMMHAGFIHNKVLREENGGITDDFWIRDTSVNGREIKVNFMNSSSEIKRNTLFLDQQLRIPFNFIEKLRAKKDSAYVVNDSTLNKDLTSAFIGHSTDFSVYSREFTGESGATDSLRTMNFENKVFIRLQPWSSESVVSKLNIGIGDRLRNYADASPLRSPKRVENNFYLYAGAEGQVKKYLFWDAKGFYNLIGTDAADFKIEANAKFNIYPFRRAKFSPLSISAHFETGLQSPYWYEKHMHTVSYVWDNDLNKISTTKIQGTIDIPRWRLNASVGYALLGNQTYYGPTGEIQQSGSAVSVLTASLDKNFTIAKVLHFDNRALFQISSNDYVMPLPKLAFNLRYYVEFVIQRDETKTHNIMAMQIGANLFYNSPWHAPAWNPALGVFYNQSDFTYTNGPIIDAFINVQWKRACIFLKVENVGMGWPAKRYDYFSAAHQISTQRSFKLGVWWPFYLQPNRNGAVKKS